MRRFALPLLLALLFVAPSAMAQESTAPTPPASPRPAPKLAPQAQVDALQARLEAVSNQLAVLGPKLDAAIRAFRAAYWRQQAARAGLAGARAALSAHIRMLYMLGPGHTLGALLNVTTPADIETIQQVMAPEVAADAAAIDRAESASRAANASAAETARLQQQAQSTYAEMYALVAELKHRVEVTVPIAQSAGVDTTEIEKRTHQLQDTVEHHHQNMLNAFNGWGYGQLPEDRLLRLLGSDGGRGCAIPDGLSDTHQNIHGVSSWYGAENGPGTASGMTFDPKLFTAAHLTLPFGTFLRVHHGNRCAIVLINDRGPYVSGRVLDLSWAAADYLHVSVAAISADILIPK